MATADRILQLKLVSDVTSASKGMKTMQKDLTKVQKAQGKLTSGFKSMGGVLAGAITVGVAVDVLKTGIDDFLAAEDAARDFDRVIRQLSHNVPRDMAKVEKAMEHALSLNFDDTEFQVALTGLMSRMRFGVPKALRVMETAMDLVAAGVFPDLESATKGVEAALRGKKKALERLGLPTDKVIKDSELLTKLERRYGQAAEEERASWAGRWTQIQVQFGEFVEGLVGQAFTFADSFNTTLQGATGGDWMTALQTVVDVGFAATQAKMTEAGVGIATEAVAIGTGIKSGIADPVAALASLVSTGFANIADAISGKQEAIGTASQGVADALRTPIVNALGVIEQRGTESVNSLISALDRMKAKLQAARIPLFGKVLTVPGLAEGGIVTRPTLAMIGERGPEAVVPLRGGGAGITINVTAGVGDPVEIGRQIDRALRAYRVRAGVAA